MELPKATRVRSAGAPMGLEPPPPVSAVPGPLQQPSNLHCRRINSGDASNAVHAVNGKRPVPEIDTKKLNFGDELDEGAEENGAILSLGESTAQRWA